MKCEECLNLIEEYIDGELDEPVTRLVNVHLAACEMCALRYEELQGEMEVYARYRRDVEVTPALWQEVQARIEAGKIVPQRKPFTRLSEGLTAVFTLPYLNPALAAALVMVAFGGTIGMLSYIHYHQQTKHNSQIATQSGKNGPIKSTIDESDPSNLISNSPHVDSLPLSEITTAGNVSESTEDRSSQPTEGIVIKTAELRRGASGYSLMNTRVHDEDVIFNDDMAAIPESVFLDVHDAETARYVEKAQMLLRWFKNSSLPEDETFLDISYEKQRSRELLNENVLRRRDAETQGNLPTEELLSSLEPFLLDIANLPDKPSPDEVRSIKERIQKKEIIAALALH